MDPDLQVSHIFNFTLLGSLHNAARKTRYWIVYSLMNKDLFADSGTASREIKINGAAWMATALLSLGYLATGQRWLLAPLPLLWGVNIFVSRHLFKAFYKAGSAFFAFMAGVYYTMIYPAAVWTGFFRGVIQYLVMNKQQPPQGDARRSSSSDSARE
jgi:hypothetical protein